MNRQRQREREIQRQRERQHINAMMTESVVFMSLWPRVLAFRSEEYLAIILAVERKHLSDFLASSSSLK